MDAEKAAIERVKMEQRAATMRGAESLRKTKALHGENYKTKNPHHQTRWVDMTTKEYRRFGA